MYLETVDMISGHGLATNAGIQLSSIISNVDTKWYIWHIKLRIYRYMGKCIRKSRYDARPLLGEKILRPISSIVSILDVSWYIWHIKLSSDIWKYTPKNSLRDYVSGRVDMILGHSLVSHAPSPLSSTISIQDTSWYIWQIIISSDIYANEHLVFIQGLYNWESRYDTWPRLSDTRHQPITKYHIDSDYSMIYRA